MKWGKKGLIYCPDGTLGWAKYAVKTPTPIILGDKIRIYCGFRDNDGVSRIGYIDVCPENPLKVINISSKPVLDIGENGHFDDNGMILGDVLQFQRNMDVLCWLSKGKQGEVSRLQWAGN